MGSSLALTNKTSRRGRASSAPRSRKWTHLLGRKHHQPPPEREALPDPGICGSAPALRISDEPWKVSHWKSRVSYLLTQKARGQPLAPVSASFATRFSLLSDPRGVTNWLASWNERTEEQRFAYIII